MCFYWIYTYIYNVIFYRMIIFVADPKGLLGLCSETPSSPNFFIVMGIDDLVN